MGLPDAGHNARAQAQPASQALPQTTAPRPNSQQLPNLGDGSEMTFSAERRLGDRIARELYRDPDYIDDPVIGEYVQSIWQPLLAAARLRGDLQPEMDQRFAWEILLGKDRVINAFALPGGYFGLNLGLVAAVTNRDELASVLAHEMSHVTQRHILRLMAKDSAQTPWLIGAMILGAMAASKNPDAANALIVGGQAVAAQNQLNFSRDMEREADRNGFGVLTQAGFEPRGFVTMFDKLQQAARLNDNGAFPYLRSHPLTTERIADMQARLPGGAAANRSATSITPVSALDGLLEHAMVSARARVLSNSGVDTLRAWAVEADTVKEQAATSQTAAKLSGTLYGATFAAIKLRDFGRARVLLAQLGPIVAEMAPGNKSRAGRLVRMLDAELALASDNPVRAVNALAGVATSSAVPPVSRAELLLWAQAATRSGKADIAAQSLQTWTATHARDAQAWQALSAAYVAQGQTLRAIRAEAEAQVAELNYDAAASRLKAAQELVATAKPTAAGAAADHIEASIIDTRARAVQALLREQALER